MTTLGRRHRAKSRHGGWYVGGLAIVVVGVVAAGTLLEGGSPPASGTPPRTGWAEMDPSFEAPAPPGGSQRYVFPVASGSVTYERTHHDYPATDIIATCGAPVLAVTDGTILEVSRTDTYDEATDDGASRGGLFVSLLGDDGVRFYGSHLRSLSPVALAGARVHRGDQLGTVGDTGHAGVCHLHFGISPPCARVGDWWVRRGTVWPASYLDAWRLGESTSPAAEVREWNRSHGCPGAPPP